MPPSIHWFPSLSFSHYPTGAARLSFGLVTIYTGLVTRDGFLDRRPAVTPESGNGKNRALVLGRGSRNGNEWSSYLTDPVMPATKCFCIRKNTRAVGTVAMTMAVMIRP